MREYSVIGRSAVRVLVEGKRYSLRFRSSYQDECYYDLNSDDGECKEFSLSKIKGLEKGHPVRIAYAGLHHLQWSEFKKSANDGHFGNGGFKEALGYLRPKN